MLLLSLFIPKFFAFLYLSTILMYREGSLISDFNKLNLYFFNLFLKLSPFLCEVLFYHLSYEALTWTHFTFLHDILPNFIIQFFAFLYNVLFHFVSFFFKLILSLLVQQILRNHFLHVLVEGVVLFFQIVVFIELSF